MSPPAPASDDASLDNPSLLRAGSSERSVEVSLRAAPRGGRLGLAGEFTGSGLCCLALAALGLGVMQAFGGLTDAALLLVAASLALAVMALRTGLRIAGRTWWVVITVIVGLTNLLYPRLGGPFGYHVGAQVALALALTATAGAACVLRSGRVALALLGTAALCLVGLMAVTWNWGAGKIDVLSAVSGATAALLHGANPYGPVFTMYIGQYPWHVHAHFVYGPIVPVLAALGWLVGDVRVMSVAALGVTFAGLWLLARQGGHRVDAHRVVALAIASPFNVGMVNRGWVEVYIVAGVVMWLALRGLRRRLAVACLGVALLVNPLTPLVLLPAFLWSRRARREIVAAAIGAAIFALPFILIAGVGPFYSAVIGFQLSMPVWPGALTVTAFTLQSWHLALSSLVTVMVVLIALAVIGWRGRPHCLGDLPVQSAGLLLAAFLFAKLAFFNEYYLAAAMLVTGLAGVGIALPSGDVALPDVRALRRLVPGWRPPRPEGSTVDGAGVAPLG